MKPPMKASSGLMWYRPWHRNHLPIQKGFEISFFSNFPGCVNSWLCTGSQEQLTIKWDILRSSYSLYNWHTKSNFSAIQVKIFLTTIFTVKHWDLSIFFQNTPVKWLATVYWYINIYHQKNSLKYRFHISQHQFCKHWLSKLIVWEV